MADVLLVEEHPHGFLYIRTPQGAAPLPPGCLAEGKVVRMWNRIVPTVTREGLYVLKAGDSLRDAGAAPNPRRDEDLALIRDLLTPAKAAELNALCRPAPLPGSFTGEGTSGAGPFGTGSEDLHG